MEVSLHEHQLTVFNDPHRFKVVAAGRRFGKTFLAALLLFVEGAKTEKTRLDGVTVDLSLEEVYYVCPTFTQGKKIIWPLMKLIGRDLIKQAYEKDGELILKNGRRISIQGTDKPDNIRGTGLSFVVLDEYAFMRDWVWEAILEPQLMHSEGGALFIGTPDGKNHFYELWTKGQDKAEEEWVSWTFHSEQNPFLPEAELSKKKLNMSAARYRQELEASFSGTGGGSMTSDMFAIVEKAPTDGDIYTCCDLAGFTTTGEGRKERRSDHAIATVMVHEYGWCILDVVYGRWDPRETALRIIKAFRDHRPLKLGIEKGMSREAVLPYLEDEQNRLGLYFPIQELRHGNQRKQDRIEWALQGRAEKGRIQLLKGDWNVKFIEQAQDFPTELAPDDVIDAVSYVDQIADPWYEMPNSGIIDDWAPLDDISGY